MPIKRKPAKKIRRIDIKSSVQKQPSRPRKRVKLSKDDPDYYSKIGKISAEKRQISSETFREWAHRSHAKRKKSSYRGGRPPKNKS